MKFDVKWHNLFRTEEMDLLVPSGFNKESSMSKVLRSSKLRNLPKTERLRRIGAFVNSAKPVDSRLRVRQLNADIAKFRKKYGMSTEKMCKKLCAGEIPNTGDFAIWSAKQAILTTHKANVCQA